MGTMPHHYTHYFEQFIDLWVRCATTYISPDDSWICGDDALLQHSTRTVHGFSGTMRHYRHFFERLMDLWVQCSTMYLSRTIHGFVGTTCCSNISPGLFMELWGRCNLCGTEIFPNDLRNCGYNVLLQKFIRVTCMELSQR